MRKGFTLLELLVCMAIIAVLAGLSTPVFATVRERGKHTASLENLRSLHQALLLYRADHPGSDAGTAEEMGLPGKRVPQALHSIYASSGWKGRSPFGYNTTVFPGILEDKIIHTLLYHPFWESDVEGLPESAKNWSQATRASGESTWLFLRSPLRLRGELP